jgi:hypothetical protein
MPPHTALDGLGGWLLKNSGTSAITVAPGNLTCRAGVRGGQLPDVGHFNP